MLETIVFFFALFFTLGFIADFANILVKRKQENKNRYTTAFIRFSCIIFWSWLYYLNT